MWQEFTLFESCQDNAAVVAASKMCINGSNYRFLELLD
jgi:hypothetical protein